MNLTRQPTIARKGAATLLLLLALGLLLLASPARAAQIVNVTVNIPATVYDNPCVGEPVSLSGDLHLILNITTDSSGGYHFVSKWNASYTGTGLISGATYKASESKQESWSASQLPCPPPTPPPRSSS